MLWKEYGRIERSISRDSIDLLWRWLGLLESQGSRFLGDCIP
ncbi:hypothetical protein [Microcoleus vaginatus]